MHRYTKLLLASLAATALLMMAVGSASANRLSTSSQRYRATWTSLELSNTVNSNTVRCAVTLEGTFHSATIVKTSGALIGYVNRASVNACTGGSATIHTETLPWHVRYRGYSGILPNITLIIIGLVGASFEIHDNSSGNTCSATTETLHPAVGRISLNSTTHVAENLTAEPGARIRLVNGRGGIFCGLSEGAFGGTSQTLAEPTTGNRITVTLI